MDYILGVITAVFAVYAVKMFWQPLAQSKPVHIKYSQSHIFDMIRPSIEMMLSMPEYVETQSRKHLERNIVNVLIYEDRAYWIRENSVFVANVVDGVVDQQSTQTVNAINMDKLEIEKLNFVIEQLTKGGSDDSRNPRNSKF